MKTKKFGQKKHTVKRLACGWQEMVAAAMMKTAPR
jgi:hypothetical protein